MLGPIPHPSQPSPAPHIERRLRHSYADGVDARVARRAAEQRGVVSLAELQACGLSRQAIHWRVLHGRLFRIHGEVYAVGHRNLPLEGRFLAAVKACGPTAALSYYSAGADWRMVEWDERRVEVTVVGDGTRLHPGLRVHRTQLLEPRDIRHHNGIRVTSPARTLVDLASLLDYRPLRRAVRQAQSLRLVSLPELAKTIERLGPRRGVRNLRRILATGPAPTRSELEDVVLDLILGGGLAHPEVNVPVSIDGRRVVPDFRWPDQRLVVEADGAAWHDHKLAREDDAERQALLEAFGDQVLRVTWDQAIARPSQSLERIIAAGAPLDRRVSAASRIR
jgi:Protein of unknown function (DUF559)/Transcriptional regulator, AbiEi antitoxin